MTASEYLEKIALFYYFNYLDESKAQSATSATIKQFRNTRLKNEAGDILSREVVRTTQAFLKTEKSFIKPTRLSFSTDYIVLPEGSNWGPWFEFRKKANDSEVHTVLYSQILNISELEISEGWKIPEGTIRYRLSNALKTMSSIFRNERSGNDRKD